MKSIALALVATAALSLPALAQTSPNTNEQNQNPSSSSQMQTNPSGGMQSNSGASSSGGMKSEISTPISPESLSKDQIKQVQQALNQNGFQNVKPDGIWGPDTADALKQFQQKQNLQANGKLDQQTLSALNVQVGGSMQQGRAATGTPPEQNNTNSMQNNNANGSMNENNGTKSMTGNGMKPESGNSSH